MHRGHYWESSNRRHKENQGEGGWVILQWILLTWNGVEWIELVWLIIGTGGGLLRRR
jgi:hypothetical protein